MPEPQQPAIRQVPLHERAFRTPHMTGINGYRANLPLLKQRLQTGGYHVQETPHFLVCTRPQEPRTIVVHRLAPAAIDATIGAYFIQELQPLGLLEDSASYGDLFAAIVCSLNPQQPQQALRLYALNTLRQYERLLSVSATLPSIETPIGVFARLYRRVLPLLQGESLLDAGCSFGFLPLLAAQARPELTQSLGVDLRDDSFALMRTLAHERGLNQVSYAQLDLLSSVLPTLSPGGRFGNLTLLHVLEHFYEAEMKQVLAALLPTIEQRLFIAVPYEPGEPERAYGHRQLFTPASLEKLGDWCLAFRGRGQASCEECAGGLLIIDFSES